MTLIPEHIAPEGFAEINTLAGRLGFTVIAIPFDIAGLPVRHGDAFDVITHVTTSVFTKAELVYVGEFIPTSVVPFNFH